MLAHRTARIAGLNAATPAVKTIDVLIVGAGFGGLAMAHALDGLGECDYLIVEKAQGLGGTWRDNSYPGAACDVPSLSLIHI